MARFSKNPIVVDAEQFTHPATSPRGVFVGEDGECWVVTVHGHKTPVVPGDWIIAESDGKHYYPCKPDVFAQIYQPIKE
jgi:quercetin dioxygenase-like cupin family protein